MSENNTASLVCPDSLGDTLDRVNAAIFFHKPAVIEAWTEAAQWIADRQGLPRSYVGMFAPTGYDVAFGALTFTGEPVQSTAAVGHVMSEEACRVLFWLSRIPEVGGLDEVRQAIEHARERIFLRIASSEGRGDYSGIYCCGMCSAALWRHLSASGLEEDHFRLEDGISELRRHRDGSGRWKRFPFHYTLLALCDIPLPGAREELAYAAAAVERGLRRLQKMDPESRSEHDQRRMLLMQRSLELA